MCVATAVDVTGRSVTRVSDYVRELAALGFQWPTIDPFLFCVHHLDTYPAGTADYGPDPALLVGRDIGMDFTARDGWRMYHGEVVPGFPAHPHRGFETVTFARQGFIDHSDSLGYAMRFGRGDVQWMTAGRGIVHAEMFPLLDRDNPNPAELFQIWVNLPASDKLVDPYFTMLWGEDLVHHRVGLGPNEARVTAIAGALDGQSPPKPPPNSWAARVDADVAIWHIDLDPDAQFVLPATRDAMTVRTLYCYEGVTLVGDEVVTAPTAAVLTEAVEVPLRGGPPGGQCLLLQGRPIGEPVAQQGPFVMNTRAELVEAFEEYRRTQFGGWPWDRVDPVHGPKPERLARRPDRL
jgi:quercetin 2,3-dioxygenase